MPTSLVAVRLATVTATLAAIERIHAAGDAVLPLDPSAPEPAVAAAIERLRPQALVHPTPAGSRQKVTRLPDGAPVPDDTAAVVATSGSTGVPRGVVLSHTAMRASARASVDRLGCRPGDRLVLCLPLHHVAGLQIPVRSRLLGTDPVVLERFSVEGVAATDAPWVPLVPTMLRRLLDADTDLTGRTVLLGGAAATEQLLAGAVAAGARVVTSYGMTETCGGCVYDGVPLDGVEVTTTPEGRIAIRGGVLATGTRQPDGTVLPLTDDDGWFVTGDRGAVTDGVLVVHGRADTVIVTGGENVAAEAVEQCLTAHPAVTSAAVLGRPDPEWGERVVTVIVPVSRDKAPSLDDLRAHVRARLGAAAAPRELHVAAALPLTSLGKVDRPALRRVVEDVAPLEP